MDTLRIIGSLILVFGLMGALLWGLKRMQTQMGQSLPGRRLQIVESVGVGPRQKIALVRVDGHEVLVGLSPGQMTALGQWPVTGAAAGAAAGAVPGAATTCGVSWTGAATCAAGGL